MISVVIPAALWGKFVNQFSALGQSGYSLAQSIIYNTGYRRVGGTREMIARLATIDEALFLKGHAVDQSVECMELFKATNAEALREESEAWLTVSVGAIEARKTMESERKHPQGYSEDEYAS